MYGKVDRRLGQKQKREKTEGATGLGRITRQQIESWNKMTRQKKRPASLRAVW